MNNSQFSTLNSQFPKNRTTILLVEDNPNYMEINRTALTKKGYSILEADTLAKGRELVLSEAPDLIILDIMLPDGNGLALCEELRKGSQIPILFLSAKKEDADQLAGFEAGGDDYLSKPYNLNILIKRVESVLSRARYVPDVLVKGRLVIDLVSGTVTFGGKNLDIKGKAYDVLFFLAKRENKVFTAEQIYERVWGQEMARNNNAVKKAISILNNELKKTDYTISNEYGKGYSFENG